MFQAINGKSKEIARVYRECSALFLEWQYKIVWLMFLLLGAKGAWFTIYCSMRLYAVILILNCFSDYAGCITSASNSLMSLSSKLGKQSDTSSIFIFPNVKSLRAFSFVSS